MIDLKKEIKLSDLVRKTAEEAASTPGVAAEPKPAQAQAPKKQRARRPQDRRVADRGRAGRQQRLGASCVQLARQPLAAGIVVGGEVRDVAGARGRRSTSSSRDNKLPRRGVRLGHRDEPRRRPHASRSTGSTTSASSRTRCASARTRRSRSRSTRRCSTTTSSARRSTRRHRHAAGPARRRLPRADRPLRRGVPAGEDRSSSASTSRRSRCCARSRPRATNGTPARRRVVVVIARPRPHDARDLGRHDLRVHARARVGRREARDRDRAASSA